MKVLYVARKNLGVNLFMTPLWKHLAFKYDMVYLGPIDHFPILKDYNFFTKFIVGCEHPSRLTSKLSQSSLDEILEEFKITEEYYMLYDSDDAIVFLNNHPELKHIKPHPSILSRQEMDLKYNKFSDFFVVGESREAFLKLQLLDLSQMENFDFSIKIPFQTENRKTDTIIVYQGSKDRWRRLSNSTLLKFAKKLPNATFFISKSAIKFFHNNNVTVKYILTDPTTPSRLYDVIELFKSNPRAMIGPDSGLTQLALACGIPQIWLQSRIRPENAIDPCYFDKIHVYFRKNINCNKDCIGCAITSQYSSLNKAPFLLKVPFTEYSDLTCGVTGTPSCLDYTEDEVDEIISMIKKV